jgi:hypothetical protein
MRIDSFNLQQIPRDHGRVANAGKPFPAKAAEQANAFAKTLQAEPNTGTQQAKAAATDSREKQLPAGLLAAQQRFAAMKLDEMNRGQTQAMESINRNIARYQDIQGIATQSAPSTTSGAPSTISTTA